MWLEHEGLLDPSSDVDLWCLQTLFGPVINDGLSLFVSSWNEHTLRTEGRSPQQLFIGGMQAIAATTSRLSDEFFAVGKHVAH